MWETDKKNHSRVDGLKTFQLYANETRNGSHENKYKYRINEYGYWSRRGNWKNIDDKFKIYKSIARKDFVDRPTKVLWGKITARRPLHQIQSKFGVYEIIV